MKPLFLFIPQAWYHAGLLMQYHYSTVVGIASLADITTQVRGSIQPTLVIVSACNIKSHGGSCVYLHVHVLLPTPRLCQWQH